MADGEDVACGFGEGLDVDLADEVLAEVEEGGARLGVGGDGARGEDLGDADGGRVGEEEGGRGEGEGLGEVPRRAEVEARAAPAWFFFAGVVDFAVVDLARDEGGLARAPGAVGNDCLDDLAVFLDLELRE